MAEASKEPVVAVKKKVARCDKTCTYVGGGTEPRRCKSRCSREVGHFLNCKCRSHDMQ